MSIRIGREVVSDEELRHLARPRDPAKGFSDTGYRHVYARDSGRTFRVRLKLPGARARGAKYIDLSGPYPTERVAAAAAVVELRRLYGAEWWRDRAGRPDRRPVVRPREAEKNSWVCDVWAFGVALPVVLDPREVSRSDRRGFWPSRRDAVLAAMAWVRREYGLFGTRVLGRGTFRVPPEDVRKELVRGGRKRRGRRKTHAPHGPPLFPAAAAETRRAA